MRAVVASLALLAFVATATGSASLVDPPSSAISRSAKVEFRLSLGAEWDTNALRAVSGNASMLPGAALDVVGDGVTRLIADVKSAFRLAEGHELDLGYVLGAKRFFARD